VNVFNNIKNRLGEYSIFVVEGVASEEEDHYPASTDFINVGDYLILLSRL